MSTYAYAYTLVRTSLYHTSPSPRDFLISSKRYQNPSLSQTEYLKFREIASCFVLFISNQISMNAPVTLVRTVEPASTEWMGSCAAVNRNSLEPSVKQVSVYEMMYVFRNSRYLVSCIVPSLFWTWNIQLLSMDASLTPSFHSPFNSC